MDSAAATQFTHYAEPTIATSLKEHAKPTVPAKPSGRPLHLVQAAEKHFRLPHRAQGHCHDCPRSRRRLSDRICVSDDEADDDRLMRHSPGRLSYSDDELSGHQSPRKYGSHGTRQFSSRSTKPASRSSTTQFCDVLQQREHGDSPRPVRRGCCACSSPAASKLFSYLTFHVYSPKFVYVG